MKSRGSVTDRGEEETEDRQDGGVGGGAQTYGAAVRRRRANKLADDSLSWSELMLHRPHPPFTSPSTPIHLTCLQSNLNVCFTASLSKNYKWCAIKKIRRGGGEVIGVLGERWGVRLVRWGGGRDRITGMDQAITD